MTGVFKMTGKFSKLTFHPQGQCLCNMSVTSIAYLLSDLFLNATCITVASSVGLPEWTKFH